LEGKINKISDRTLEVVAIYQFLWTLYPPLPPPLVEEGMSQPFPVGKAILGSTRGEDQAIKDNLERVRLFPLENGSRERHRMAPLSSKVDLI
jgi:hypothetical protein